MQAQLPANWTAHESMLRPMSPQAHAIDGLWHFMIVVSAIVYVAVIAMMIYALVRARRRAAADDDAGREQTMRRAVVLCTGITIVILFTFLVYDFGVGRAVAAPTRSTRALRIQLVGHQWWWEVQYRDSAPQQRLTTANEIHVPVGRPVVFTLTSSDVIHSFWMPNLNGKKDLIPGYVNDVWFQADTPGVYRGQCAEFCGYQHAKMALLVVAESEDSFNRWYSEQLRSAAQPTQPDLVAGERVFLAGSCAMCHTISGTAAAARAGPDLTHIGSRLMLAAGTVPNTTANLSGWIMDPQHLKPGARMPPNNIAPRDLRALVLYLQSLR